MLFDWKTRRLCSHHDAASCRYNYMHSMPEKKFNSYRKHLARVMRFSAVTLGAALGIEVHAGGL